MLLRTKQLCMTIKSPIYAANIALMLLLYKIGCDGILILILMGYNYRFGIIIEMKYVKLEFLIREEGRERK